MVAGRDHGDRVVPEADDCVHPRGVYRRWYRYRGRLRHKRSTWRSRRTSGRFRGCRELSDTGRSFSGTEAKQLGLVSRVFDSKEELDNGVLLIAEGIGLKSPLAVTGTGAVLQRSRELNVEQGLDYAATWNSAMLLSDDLTEAVTAFAQKRKPVFAKL
ncbi:hypothetical protein DVH24_025143 [Malus domestica]|uniref:Enoyl-CoA hydratase n=1 Tax=Malus domestica TaxID=3750 RepID=A0A498HP19_MALDO|nr:hypothetical protein DVH24_025143 [Malus domestica]